MAGAVASGRRLRANLLLGLCAAIWGFAFVAQSEGAHIGAFTFNASRFAIGAVSLLPLVGWVDRRTGVDAAARRARWRGVLGPGLWCGAFLFGGATMQQIGIESTTAGNAAFVTGLYVVMVPLVGVLLGRRTALTTWVGAGLALVGLYLLTVTAAFTVNPGDVLCLVGTVFWTGHILSVGHFSRRLDALRLSVAQFGACALYAAVAALFLDAAPFAGVPDALGPVLFAGLVSTGVGYTLQVVAQQDALESHAAIIMSLESMFGAIGGALFLGEVMTPRGYVGAALIMSGIILSQLPPPGSRWGRRRASVPVPEPPSTALAKE